MRVIDVLIGLIVFSGCTATTAVPVSMPIWIIIGILFVFRISFRQAWLIMTVISLLQLIAISLWGIAVWIGDGYPSAGDSLFFGSISGSVITTLTLLYSRRNISSQQSRAWVVLLQSVMAVIMIGLSISAVYLQ